MAADPSRGGARPGAGRPKGSGRFAEPTQVMRLPKSTVPLIKRWLENRAQAPALLTPTPTPPPLALPFYASRVQAGFPSPADDYLDNTLDLHEYLIRNPAATFYVRAEGDSMLDAGIRPGDILVIDRAIEATDGMFVLAVLDGEFTVKELRRRNGLVELVPHNVAYPVIAVPQEVEFQIWGVVRGWIHTAL